MCELKGRANKPRIRKYRKMSLLMRLMQNPQELKQHAKNQFQRVTQDEIKRMKRALSNTKDGLESPNDEESVIHANRNVDKNRYSDVLPYDRTRVKLQGRNDYINASHIVSPSGKRWIAPQGPLPHTMIDFWNMVWQHGCTSIVMLTKTVENGRAKCHEYWPSTGALQNADWKLVPVDSDSHKELPLVTRTFNMSSGTESRVITQYHYLGWPDHGVPESPSQLIQLLRLLKTSQEPIVIHCSAGVGRTGTLITLDTLIHLGLKVWHDGDDVIFDTVSHFRKQRTLMVQSFEQYCFLYVAIAEALSACS